ncbi:Lrp/AsnC family transcriptional regulator [Streptomyces sp. NPDC058457]|uniref:Lrp/AsnC family transcriptional regulator n=1 Tax=Streptomyces sp. NPDC058457 TaxID=3346507 RepID=UPI003660729B
MHMHLGADAKWRAFDGPLTAPALGEVRCTADPGTHRGGHERRGTGGLVDADAPLLTELSRDGRAGVVELARSTGWSQARVSARLEQLLEEHAVYVAVDLAYDRFGFHATAYLWLTVAPGHLHATGEALSRHPATTFAASVTGAANLLVTVTCRTTDDLYMYVTGVVGAIPHVVQVDVVPVLHRLKHAGTRLQDGRLAAI